LGLRWRVTPRLALASQELSCHQRRAGQGSGREWRQTDYRKEG